MKIVSFFGNHGKSEEHQRINCEKSQKFNAHFWQLVLVILGSSWHNFGIIAGGRGWTGTGPAFGPRLGPRLAWAGARNVMEMKGFLAF